MHNEQNKEIKLAQTLSTTNVWALAFGCIIGWGAFVMPGNTFLVNAGPLGTLIAMAIAFVILVIIAINYNFMINRYPFAGGEFTYTEKTFGRNHSFICAWFLGLSYLAIVPLNATALSLISRNLLDNVLQIGFHYTFAGYSIYLGEILLALIAIILFGLITIRGVKMTGAFQTVLAFSLVFGVLVVSIAAVMSSKSDWNNLYPLFYPGKEPIAGILAVVAVSPWAFVGFDTIPQAAEEFNFSPKKTIGIMTLSILFGALVYILLSFVTVMVLPEHYTTWVEYINDLGNLSGLVSLPTFNAAYILLGKAGLLFLGISVLAAILSGIIGFYMATSRLLYSMARENVISQWFVKLHPKYKTPANAIIFVMIVAIIASLFGRTALGWIVDMSSTGAAIGFGYTSAAAVFLALKENNKPIIVTGVIGTFFSLVFLVLLLVPIAGLNTSLCFEAYISLIIWSLLGILFYKK